MIQKKTAAESKSIRAAQTWERRRPAGGLRWSLRSRDCVEAPCIRFVLVVLFVLVLDYSGDFEDEDDGENEKDGAFRCFSQSFLSLSSGTSQGLNSSSPSGRRRSR
jgi:hypothetical protein